ncbi:MAG: V-type ATP synthase subunit F [Candidatus Nezhaarchaeota archaeon]|nr:V-type ATP synthase subunit F [Candidatus Nezhaarchaeota archaeon]
MKIVVVGDEDAVAGFKLAGVSDGRVVRTPSEAEEVLKELVRDEEVAVLMVTEEVASMADSLVRELYLKPRPVIVKIPSRKGVEVKKEDPIRELLRRAIGVEVSVG